MHRIRSAAKATITLGAALFAVSCAENSGSLTAPDAPLVTIRQQAAVDLAEVARLVPSFGGLYLDNGVPTVFLGNPAEQPAAIRALGPWAAREGVDLGSVRVRQADYSYRQLDGWTSAVTRDVFMAPNVVFVDLNEATNRVTVGIETGTSERDVKRIAASLGVPAGAVQVVETEPVQLAATLRDQIRPVQAGLQIHWDQYVCTIGFNAVSGTTASFITNSHCSGQQGGVQNTQYDQSTRGTPGSFIGTEVADPTYFRNGACPKGKKCRYSDSARAAYAAGVSSALGTIARTTGANNNSLEIAGTFTITAENTSSTFTVGSVVNKVGRTTGWTQGQITNTCVTTGVQGSNIAQICQTFVAAGVAGGDSGSPVFSISSGTNVTLLGILWGGSGNNFVFSPLGQVEQELGALRTF